MNSFKQKLRNGEVALGQMVLELFTPGVGPMLAACGLDFVIYDMEHGRCDIAAVAEMIASCRGTGITPMARVPDLESAPLARILDLGAMGVMVPRVETRAQVERIVAELKYPPQGKRGVALGLAHDLYRPGGAAYLSHANEETSVIVIVETVRAFENLEAIVSVPGLDVAWMGHYDLTTSMGIPAQFDHPRFLGAMDSLLQVCAKYNVAPGFLPPTPADAAHWINKGFRAISLGSDIGVFRDAVRSFRDAALQQCSLRFGLEKKV
jgi:2-dehydro-3-deoxyglucarate aldolase/4-hydroxy-2-oxoheptanedioate aldolase